MYVLVICQLLHRHTHTHTHHCRTSPHHHVGKRKNVIYYDFKPAATMNDHDGHDDGPWAISFRDLCSAAPLNVRFQCLIMCWHYVAASERNNYSDLLSFFHVVRNKKHKKIWFFLIFKEKFFVWTLNDVNSYVRVYSKTVKKCHCTSSLVFRNSWNGVKMCD